MALTTSVGIPDTIVKGDGYSFTVSDVSFPVATWTAATIYFKQGTNTIRSFSGSVSGSGHLFTLTNAQTDTLFVGKNLVSVSWSDGTYRGSNDWTEINVLENPASAVTASTAENMVAALEAAMLTLSSRTSISVSVDGVSYTMRDMNSLRADWVMWKARVIAEQRAALAARCIGPGRSITSFHIP